MPFFFKVIEVNQLETVVDEKLSEEIVRAIKEFIDTKLKELEKEGLYTNRIMRDDILPLLDSQCTIIYYPTEDKENNGFHKTYRYRGNNLHFVYINTNQDIEKQIFTAAHELGHVWKVDSFLEKNLNITINADLDEKIMNRFAAELLMPEDLFDKCFDRLFSEKNRDADGITVEKIIQIITTIMNEFYVPYKAVVYRMYELDYIAPQSAKILLDGVSKELFIDYSKKYAKEQGFSRLYWPNKKKHIERLKERLDAAREKNVVPERWLQEFYARFDLELSEDVDALKEKMSVEREGER